MQQAGQVAFLHQNDAHEQSLGQSDESLRGPEQTLSQSFNQSIGFKLAELEVGPNFFRSDQVVIEPDK